MTLLRHLLPALLAFIVGISAAGPGQADPAPDPASASTAAATLRADLIRLERQVSADPANPLYRIALAQVLLRARQPARARYHLMQARGAATLTTAERHQLDQLIARIEGGRDRELWLRLAITPESNPGQRTAATEITGTWYGDLTLDPSARGRPATGVQVAGGAAWLPRLGPGLRLRLGVGVDARLFGDSQLNDINLRGELGLQGLTARGSAWGLRLITQERRLANRRHGRATGIAGSWQVMIGTASRLAISAESLRWRHVTQTGQDGTRNGLSLRFNHALRPDLLLRADAYLGRTKARAPWESGRTLALGVGVQKSFVGGWVVGVDATVLRHQRQATDPVFLGRRQDRRLILGARLLNRNISIAGFAPTLDLGFERQKSTLPIHAFRNGRVAVSLTREF